jgi:hypothetical protein
MATTCETRLVKAWALKAGAAETVSAVIDMDGYTALDKALIAYLKDRFCNEVANLEAIRVNPIDWQHIAREIVKAASRIGCKPTFTRAA